VLCRAYREAKNAYDHGKPTKEQTELLTMVDTWRLEEDGD